MFSLKMVREISCAGWRTMSKKKHFSMWSGVRIFALLIFALFFLYPVVNLFVQCLFDLKTGAVSFENFQKFFSKPYYYRTFFNSLKVTCCVTVLAMLVGMPLAYITKSCKIYGLPVINVIVIMSILSPPFVGAYSWILLLGRNGAITNFLNDVFGIHYGGIYGFSGILLVFTIQLYPLIYLYVSGALKNMDSSLDEASESLGCTGVRKIFKVIIPLILPTMLAGGLLVFMRAFSDFGTPMLIGEGYRTMPVLIYDSFISEMGGNSGFAAALSLMVVVFTTILFLGQKYFSNRKGFTMAATKPMEPKKLKGWKNVVAHIFVYLIALITVLPQATVMYTSFKNVSSSGAVFMEGYSFVSYKNVFSKLGDSIVNTFVFSLVALAIILVLGLTISYVVTRKRSAVTSVLDVIVMLPYVIPGSIIGIALLLAFVKGPVILSGTAAIIIIAYVIRRLPYTIRSSAAILQHISPSTEEAAISLGASTAKTFVKVTVPQMMPGVISGAMLSWMTIISELSASVLLYTASTKTVTIAIYTEVVYGNYGNAAALATTLLVLTLGALLLFFKISGRRDIDL